MPESLTFRPLTRGQLVFDLAAPTFLFLALATVYFDRGPALVVLVGMCAALTLRRLSPALSLAVAWLTAIVQMILGLGPDPSNLAILAVLYATASYGTTLVKWLGFASTFLGAIVITIYLLIVPVVFGVTTDGIFIPQLRPADVPQFVWSTAISMFSFLAVFILAWTLGLLAMSWRANRETRRAQLDAEKSVIVEQERNRIARDMHDVVAHSLAVVIAQADGARYARKAHPEAVDEALSTISTTAREALSDVRLLLGQLRHNEEAGPQPVLADLDKLLEQFRGAGLEVEFEQLGNAPLLPTGQQLAIYRIVQEGLTNALRHGDTSKPAVVRIEWTADAAELTVSSALGHTAPVAEESNGHGIPGMRERAAVVRGSLSTTAADGQFLVAATIPTGVQR